MYSTLVSNLRERAARRAKPARRQALLLLPLIAAVVLAYNSEVGEAQNDGDRAAV